MGPTPTSPSSVATRWCLPPSCGSTRWFGCRSRLDATAGTDTLTGDFTAAGLPGNASTLSIGPGSVGTGTAWHGPVRRLEYRCRRPPISALVTLTFGPVDD